VWGVRSFNELNKRWDDHVSRGRYHPGLTIKDAGLMLGADTLLVRMGETRSGAIDPKELTDELVVPMGGLNVAIRLPEELQSADRLTFDYSDGSFVVADH
jgi:hypothetical protein